MQAFRFLWKQNSSKCIAFLPVRKPWQRLYVRLVNKLFNLRTCTTEFSFLGLPAGAFHPASQSTQYQAGQTRPDLCNCSTEHTHTHTHLRDMVRPIYRVHLHSHAEQVHSEVLSCTVCQQYLDCVLSCATLHFSLELTSSSTHIAKLQTSW